MPAERKTMEFIRLSETLSISKIAAGCMRLADNDMSGDKLLRFTEECLDMGISTFDHANIYGNYTCEKTFGDAVLRQQPQLRNKMQIITKVGVVLPQQGRVKVYYQSDYHGIISLAEESLRRLGTDYIDLLLIHRPDIMSNPAEIAEALTRLVQSGKVREIGVSNYTPEGFDALQSYLKLKLVTNQVEMNPLHPEVYFDGTVDNAARHRIPLMAWSPLGGGNIFNPKTNCEKELHEALAELSGIYGGGMGQMLYAWILSHSYPTAIITGSTKIERIKEAVDALGTKMTHEEWYWILEKARGYSVP